VRFPHKQLCGVHIKSKSITSLDSCASISTWDTVALLSNAFTLSLLFNVWKVMHSRPALQ